MLIFQGWQLLYEEDIPTVQEHLGYRLLPTTKGQKMLMLIGKDGEGKSRIGLVMNAIFGTSMNTTSIQKVETNRFARADLESKLLKVDDDMDMNALPKTNHIKSIVTSECKMDVERKGVQSQQVQIYARFLCFGNGALTALHGRTDGFFRRQIVLTTKDKPAGRADDPFLVEKLVAEKEGIFLNIMNDAYCKDISMKIRSQLDIKRKMGDFIGAFATYGYRKDPENKNRLLVDENATRVVELIFRLRLQGMSNSRIATKLNGMGIPSPMEYKRSQGQNYECGFRVNERATWNAVSIRRVLTNELYLGTLIQHKRGTPNYKVKKEVQYGQEDWIVIEANHEPIISETDFLTVQSLLQRDVRVAPDKEATHLFAGFVYCGGCNHCMTRKVVPSHGKKYYYFVCSSHKAGEGCSSHSFSEAKLNKIVLGLVREQIKLIGQVDQVLSYSHSWVFGLSR